MKRRNFLGTTLAGATGIAVAQEKPVTPCKTRIMLEKLKEHLEKENSLFPYEILITLRQDTPPETLNHLMDLKKMNRVLFLYWRDEQEYLPPCFLLTNPFEIRNRLSWSDTMHNIRAMLPLSDDLLQWYEVRFSITDRSSGYWDNAKPVEIP